MNLYTDIQDLPEASRGAVLAIGNCDGVHKGHRALISAAKGAAQGRQVGVLTFEPHPRTLFRPDDPPFRITPAAMKARLLLEAGVDFVAAMPFDWPLASLSAEGFAAEIREVMAPHRILVGADFRFGQLRRGTPDTFAAAGIPVTPLPPVSGDDGGKYSSSDVREALRLGDIDRANAILGWEWEIAGEIVRGDRRGHELGYPTANVALGETVHPAYGIYAARVMVEGEDFWRPAAVNIGIRPMFALPVGQVEAHILDMEDRDIYGRVLRIRPVRRLRGEAKFDSLDALIFQMDADCREAREILSA